MCRLVCNFLLLTHMLALAMFILAPHCILLVILQAEGCMFPQKCVYEPSTCTYMFSSKESCALADVALFYSLPSGASDWFHQQRCMTVWSILGNSLSISLSHMHTHTHTPYRVRPSPPHSQLMIETVLIPPLGNLGYMCICIRVHVPKDCFFEGGL